MLTLRRWPLAFAVIVLIAVCSGIEARAGVQVQLGGTFGGTIETPGVDTVTAGLNIPAGTFVRILVNAAPGSTLQPMVVVTDPFGASVGTSRPRPRIVVYTLRATESGTHTIVVGGSSGSGAFTARVFGKSPAGTQPAAPTGIEGRVTNTLTGDGIAGAGVTVGAFNLVTGADGSYAAQLPPGSYDVQVSADDFVTQMTAVTLTSGATADLDAALMPVAPVIVNASVMGAAAPGAVVTATAEVRILDGSTLDSFEWVQLHGADVAMIAGGGTDTATVTLGDNLAYKEFVMHVLREPPVTAEQLPPNVPLPPGEFPGGLQDRFQVVGASPFALEESGLVALEVEVTTSSGTYHGETELHTALPWRPSAGIHNVPVGVPVLLYGKDQESYDWMLEPPGSSEATLLDDDTRTPEFTPDVPGLYEIDVTPMMTEEAGEPVTLQIYAGNWRGVIDGQDEAGRPIADMACTGCHSQFQDDKFAQWRQTGHAEILTNNLNTSTHYGPNCFGCHTVGFDPGAANGGSDDASDYAGFLGGQLINNPGDNWTTMLQLYPETAKLANVQCENCHGPQDAEPGTGSGAHHPASPDGEPRLSLSSDVCAVCHGEPLRHARFQQWQLSAHANYELAFDEGESGNCSRCHTANGFLEWLPILTGDEPGDPLDDIEVSWAVDETHPQTCVTCHDPHVIGTTSGISTNATIRISGDTPLLIAGFVATDVGRGAMCITCHNTRRGLRNDETFADFVGTSESVRAPHGGAQGDMMMGQNAYLVEVGNRGSHSFIEDSCVNCHMEQTPPPSVLSYNQGGTNHTFFAQPGICSNCHEFGAAEIQGGIEESMDELQEMIEDAWLALIAANTDPGGILLEEGQGEDPDVVIESAADVKELVFGEFRGRQSLTVTFMDDMTFGPYRLTDLEVLDGGGGSLGPIYNFADDNLLKTGWNWNLVHNDGSRGVHNWWFTYQVLEASKEALAEGAEAAALQRPRVLPRLTGDGANRRMDR